MVDVHTHILPEIDDGSESAEESLEMLKTAVSTGTTDIILTPHYSEYFDNFYGTLLKEQFYKLCAAAKDIPINLYLGMENYCTEDIAQKILFKKSITLNFSRYFMVEFSFSEQTNPRQITQKLAEIIDLGLVPVVAHPERYPYIQNFPQYVYDWVKMGCLIQINATSLMNLRGRRFNTAIRLLKHKLVHFCASDCHNLSNRTPDLSRGYVIVSKLLHKDYANLIFTINPQAVLNDKKIIIPNPLPFL